jgi:hypothetical protein
MALLVVGLSVCAIIDFPENPRIVRPNHEHRGECFGFGDFFVSFSDHSGTVG